jgi:predicted RND superfamily exporter protein
VNYLVTAFVTCLALGSLRNPVASRATLGFFGALVSVLAFAASLGATALCGVRVNVVQTMTLPFVMVGLGMDDVFILALAAQDALTSYALKSQAGSSEILVRNAFLRNHF